MSGNLNGISRLFFVMLALLCACASTRAQSSKHESGFAEVNGGRLYYEALGKGPAVLLVHGGLVDSRMWDAQMKPLSKRFRVVRFDIRGYGRSPAPTGEYYPHEDIRALLDYLKIEKATLVGLSLDGPNLQKIADTLSTKIPNASKVVIPNASHHPPVETPEEFNRILLDYLEGGKSKKAKGKS